MTKLKEPLFYNCCTACSAGSSKNTKEMILSQIEKYGEFICLGCEQKFNQILSTDCEITVQSMGESAETLITSDTIYYFEGDRGKVLNPSSPFLGFGGRWMLITKNYKQKYSTRKKIMLSNNLFHYCRIPKPFQEKFKEAGKVNSTVIGVELSELEAFKELINGISYIK